MVLNLPLAQEEENSEQGRLGPRLGNTQTIGSLVEIDLHGERSEGSSGVISSTLSYLRVNCSDFYLVFLTASLFCIALHLYPSYPQIMTCN